MIEDDWIQRVANAPKHEQIQEDGRIRRWARIPEAENTLYIEFRDHGIAETRDLDENTTLDVDADGNVLAITFEHASTRTDISRLTLEGIAA